jgi:hypothetical protein
MTTTTSTPTTARARLSSRDADALVRALAEVLRAYPREVGVLLAARARGAGGSDELSTTIVSMTHRKRIQNV